MMRTDYQQLLMDRDYLLEVGEMYHRALKEKETEVDQHTPALVSTHGFLKATQIALQESESIFEELFEEASQGSTTYISTESHIYTSAQDCQSVGVKRERGSTFFKKWSGAKCLQSVYIYIQKKTCRTPN
jgi:hypothetical protein